MASESNQRVGSGKFAHEPDKDSEPQVKGGQQEQMQVLLEKNEKLRAALLVAKHCVPEGLREERDQIDQALK